MHTRFVRGVTLAGAAAVLAACGGGGKSADTARTAGADTAAMRHDSAATAAATPAAPAALTDPNIVALLDEANMADSASGALAQQKATNKDVKAFGQQMMRDHHALRQQGQDLAKKLNVTPQAPAGDTLPAHHKKMTDSLTAQAGGAAWDQAYIGHEVAMHQAVLATVDQALAAAKNAELKDLLTKARPNIEAHLKKAQDIQGKLGGGAGTSGTKKP